MPAAVLGQVRTVANVWQEAFELVSVPAYTYGVGSIRLVNTGATDATVSIAIGNVAVGNNPADKDYIVKDLVLSSQVSPAGAPPTGGTDGEIFEKNNIIFITGESFFVIGDTADVECRVDGLLFNTTTNFEFVKNLTLPDTADNLLLYNAGGGVAPTTTMEDIINATFGTFNLDIINTHATDAIEITVKVGLAGAEKEIEYKHVLEVNERLERNCLILSPNENVLVQSNVANAAQVRLSAIVNKPVP